VKSPHRGAAVINKRKQSAKNNLPKSEFLALFYPRRGSRRIYSVFQMRVPIRSPAPLWGTAVNVNLLTSAAAHKGRGLRNLFIQMKNAVKGHSASQLKEAVMRKMLLLSLAAILIVALPAFAQEKEAAKEAMPMPPAPLADDLFKWLVGEWEGATSSAMGNSQDWQKFELGLDNQFLMMHYTAQMAEGTYKGMGQTTINPATGEITGYWFDNWRGVYKGTGRREGNKVNMTWEGPMGTRTETMEKVSDNKLVVTFTNKEPNGNVTEGRTEFTRKKAVGKT
jgi:hypothetical protein